MFNKSVIFRSIVIDNQTIIIVNTDPSWFPTTWLMIVGIFILIVCIILHAIRPAHRSDADYPFELSRIQPNYCNTDGSTERRGDVRHDY